MHGARNVGGGEYSIFFLIKYLKKDIFSPVVFYTHENEIVKRLKEDGIKLVKIPLNEKITSIYRDAIKKDPISLFVYARYLIAGIIEVTRLLKRNDVDILHPHDNLSKIIGGVAAKIAGVRVVVHCRDLLRESLIEKALIYYQLLFMDRIVAVSESNRNLFKIGRKVPNKVCTIYNGIELKKFDCLAKDSVREVLDIKDIDIAIGIIGVFDKCKGHIYLFKALERLLSEGIKNIVCLVVGDGREREALEKFVLNKRLQNHIKFLGYRRDIPELLRAIDIVVMPSTQESFPRVPLEAMAMKVPVIATTVGGLPESIDNGKTGILIPPRDVDSLCKAVRFMVENPDVRKKMGDAGRKRVEEHFSIDENVRKTEELYLNVLENSLKSY